MSYKIKSIPAFDRQAKKLAKKYHSFGADFRNLIEDLRENPIQGDRLRKNCFKVRMKSVLRRKASLVERE